MKGYRDMTTKSKGQSWIRSHGGGETKKGQGKLDYGLYHFTVSMPNCYGEMRYLLRLCRRMSLSLGAIC